MVIITHIYRKWNFYNPAMSVGAWVNRIAHNQFVNILRNNYSNTASPCSRCPCNLKDGSDGCSLFGKQNSDCKLYDKWRDGTKNLEGALKLTIDTASLPFALFLARIYHSIISEAGSNSYENRPDVQIKKLFHEFTNLVGTKLFYSKSTELFDLQNFFHFNLKIFFIFVCKLFFVLQNFFSMVFKNFC